jgi:hypothetical protein
MCSPLTLETGRYEFAMHWIEQSGSESLNMAAIVAAGRSSEPHLLETTSLSLPANVDRMCASSSMASAFEPALRSKL